MLGQPDIQGIARAATQPTFSITWQKMPPKLLQAKGKGVMPTKADRKSMVRRIVEDVQNQVPFAESAIFESIGAKIHSKFPTSFINIF